MALAGSNRKPALTAAARKISFTRADTTRLREEDWQVRAWQVYDRLPAVFYMTRYRSDIASKIEYFVGIVEDPSEDPTVDEGQGSKVLETEGGPELLRRLVSEMVVHWDVPGEAYLTRFDEEPFWRVLSTQELKKEGKRFIWGDEANELGTIDSDNVYRVWDPHPRFHWQADSPTRHIIEDAEELILIGRESKARSMSRLSAGILWIPENVEVSPYGTDESGDEDDFGRELTTRMSAPVSDAGSAASLVPWVISAHKDDIAAVRHMTFDRDWDINLELRRELLRSVATGLDLPPEILTGIADLNHWSAWLVSEMAVSQHVLPTVDAILDSLTVNWFRPLLEASGVDPDLFVLWRDPSPATVPPDQSDVVLRAFELGAVGGPAVRRVINMDETDAPTADEVAARQQANQPSGSESPRNEKTPPDRDGVQASIDPDFLTELAAAVAERLKEGDPPLGEAAVTAAVRRRVDAKPLADIDRDLLAWLVDETQTEIDRLLGVVEKSLTAASDPLDETLLARFRSRVEKKIAEAQAAARSWVERLTGRVTDFVDEAQTRSVGLDLIVGGVLEAIRRRLFTPGARPDPIDIGQLPDTLPPTDLLRRGLTVAGGGKARFEDAATVDMIGNGQRIHDELEANGFHPEMYIWIYGHPANSFEPHRRLSGVEFDSWESPKLAVSVDGSWVGGSHFRPGDHRGCQCSFEQVLVSPLDVNATPEDLLAQARAAQEASRKRSEELRRAYEPPKGRTATAGSLREAAARLIEAAPKKYKRLFTDGVDDLERALATLPESVHLRFVQAMDRLEAFKVTTVTGRPRGYRAGSVGTLTNVQTDKYPFLQMETRRYNEAWNRWQVDKIGDEPDFWRQATSQEISEVLAHELTHANQWFAEYDARLAFKMVPETSALWQQGGHLQRFRTLKVDNPEFNYGASSIGESMAEATRMYMHGLKGQPTLTGWTGEMSAIDWRATYPDLAGAVETIIWGLA